MTTLVKAHLQKTSNVANAIQYNGAKTMRTLGLIMMTTVLGACAGSPSDDRYVDYGQIKSERVRIPPCNPFQADELMDWATDLDTYANHDRSAKVAVDADGRVRCSSKESARSTYTR